MAIVSSGLTVFKIAFQDVADISREIPITPLFATDLSHMALFWGETWIIFTFWTHLLKAAPDVFLLFWRI